jgi:hypothetical protein
LLLLVTATAAKAGPTMSNYNESFAAGAVSPTSEAHISFIHKTSHIIEPSNAHLANIGVELLKPPADFTDSTPFGAKINKFPLLLQYLSAYGGLVQSLAFNLKKYNISFSSLFNKAHTGRTFELYPSTHRKYF